MSSQTIRTPNLGSAGSGGGSHPAQDYSDVLKASGYVAYIERNRKHCMAGYDSLHAMAGVLRKAIERGGGRWWALGIDVKLQAKRITRPIEHAADLHLEAATALRTSYELYLGSIGAPGAGKHAPGGVFDPTK